MEKRWSPASPSITGAARRRALPGTLRRPHRTLDPTKIAEIFAERQLAVDVDMPSATDLYFPLDDANYEAQFIPHVTLLPIPSLWGHTARAASNPADAKFLNNHIGSFLAAR